ncbi:histidine--tRNA ligase [Candidatus Woesearchaeota archaeon]|nr:histidine--tRNA ligase [Candidatus Woesearchaeota archaeon]
MELINAKGTKDFLPEEKILREEIISIIKEIFEKYGFNPIETPILERYDILTAKFAAGQESDVMKEIFKLQDQGGRDLGLRYELTFALARVIGMNPNIKMPFKRYQLGEVFRDGPLKLGRMRQFWQCDVDVVGIQSVAADAEILSLAQDVFKALNLEVSIEVNDRKLLNEILAKAKVEKSIQIPVLIILDKFKKIGEKEVITELRKKNLTQEQCNFILTAISITGSNDEKLAKLKKILSEESIDELEKFFSYLSKFNVKFSFNPSLVRGLGYYTGPIYEAYLKKSEVKSSVAGGGRWDNMIGNYLGNDKKYYATGISFGLEPIYEAIKMRRKEVKKSVVQIYLIALGTEKEAIRIAQALRKNNIQADLDLAGKGISKNLEYANTLSIPYVLIIGKEELKKKKLRLKDMKTGKERLLTLAEVTKSLIKKKIPLS